MPCGPGPASTSTSTCSRGLETLPVSLRCVIDGRQLLRGRKRVWTCRNARFPHLHLAIDSDPANDSMPPPSADLLQSRGISFGVAPIRSSRRHRHPQTLPESHPMNSVVLLLLLLCISSCAGGSDVQCLKGLTASLGDPEDYICGLAFVECWNDGSIMSLNLGGMGLQGSFPGGLQFCTSMTSLDLSGNDLTGPLPVDIDRQLPFVTSLDLSSNGFSGEIPRGIGNMTYLNTVNLQHNRFTGQIPDLIGDLARLVSLNVADNSLSGPIPGSLQKFSAENFAGNDGLCGAPLGRCERRRRVRPVRIRLRLRRVSNASSISGAVGFVVGFVVAFYFPQWFVFCGSLRHYIVPVCA